jgi:hypothetical protein
MIEIDFIKKIPQRLHDNSKVWIYQSNRPFLKHEVIEIDNVLKDYVAQWKSHGDKVNGFATILFDYFILLIADESDAMVSGCSTDSSVKMIKHIEEKFSLNLFDRQNLSFLSDENILQIRLAELNNALENKLINLSTLFFNNTITTKKELLTQWIVPINNSWLMKKITTQLA